MTTERVRRFRAKPAIARLPLCRHVRDVLFGKFKAGGRMRWILRGEKAMTGVYIPQR